ncbi:MAG: NADP-specific glutamate dehydrogenase [Phycisphaerales bacterium]|nr:NADP-specific glutamate dehydrogenase [Planctomycetota bacterium]MCH8508371.1 NADP-specific glutamate dehydrogenase [Phycisphaerales bacterium]
MAIDTLPGKNLSEIIDAIEPGPLFRAAIEEVGESVAPLVEDNKKYRKARIFERLLIPDRVIRFRVEWLDDDNKVRINTGWRVEHCNLLGPYKGGLRFHPSVTEDTLQFLAYEQCFKNALTGLPLGGGKGGSDFDPKDKSDEEVMRFCQAFMRELARHIGPDIDVPAGDIGVGGREIGYLYGQWLKMTRRPGGVLTGKPTEMGGIPGRVEATGFGLVAFAKAMLEQADDSIEGKRVMISGAGNVALYAAVRARQLGATVVSLSDSGGCLIAEKGLSEEQIEEIRDFKENQRGRFKDYDAKGVKFHKDKEPWGLTEAAVALPCATQHEIDDDEAATLADIGVRFVAEGANMPCTHDARAVFRKKGVRFGPGKAANAGGVACSGFEMHQNASHASWTKKDTLEKLEQLMHEIHELTLKHAVEANGVPDYGVGADRAGFTKLADAMVAAGV